MAHDCGGVGKHFNCEGSYTTSFEGVAFGYKIDKVIAQTDGAIGISATIVDAGTFYTATLDQFGEVTMCEGDVNAFIEIATSYLQAW